MNDGSGPTSRQLLAEWTHDPACACSNASPACSQLTTVSLFPVSFTDWPRSAMWDATGLYELPTSARVTSANGGSVLLRTPTVQIAVNGGSQHPEKRKAGGHGPTLADEVEHLLPTPTRSDGAGGPHQARISWENASKPSGEGGASRLRDVAQLLPTPRSSQGGPATTEWQEANRKHGKRLEEVLLPTPSAGIWNDGENLDSWEARRQKNLQKGINGNGQGTPLSVAVAMLPTPQSSDWKGSAQTQGRDRNMRGKMHPRGTGDMDLPEAVISGVLSPQPSPAGRTFSDGQLPGQLSLDDLETG